MKKIITIQYEVEYDDSLYGDWSNRAIMNQYVEGNWDVVADVDMAPAVIIAVNDATVESEKADADAEGTT